MFHRRPRKFAGRGVKSEESRDAENRDFETKQALFNSIMQLGHKLGTACGNRFPQLQIPMKIYLDINKCADMPSRYQQALSNILNRLDPSGHSRRVGLGGGGAMGQPRLLLGWHRDGCHRGIID